MQIFRQLAEIPPNFGPTVATIGNFDGVHRGHQWVIAEVVARARALGVRSIAITFDPHPPRVLRPESTQPLITPLDEKLELLAATGIDAVLILPFSKEFSRTSARTFATLGLTANGTYRVASWTGKWAFRCRPPPPGASRPSTAR